MNLRDLVRTQKGNRTFAQLSIDCGGYPSDKRLQQLATSKQKNFPDPETIQALAKGLRVTQVTVVLAAAEDLGLDVAKATPKVLDYLPAGVNELDDDQLFAIGNMIRSFIPATGQSEADVIQMGDVNRRQGKWRSIDVAPDQAKSSDLDERLAPAADDVIPDVDELPGGSDERD